MEPTQLMIKINPAVQSNKDLHQKTNVQAIANTKSFDQILSLFNLLQTPLSNGVSEKTAIKNSTEIEGISSQNHDNLSEEDWLELDTILQELFGLFQQLLPIVQTTSQTETLTISTRQTETTIGQPLQQVIGDVRAELVEWLEKAGGIESLSQSDKNQLIEKIAQYTNEIPTSEKINLNRPTASNRTQREFTATSSASGTAEMKVANNQTTNSQIVLDQTNMLEQIMRLFGITEQVEATNSPAINIRDGTNKVDANPLFMGTFTRNPHDYLLNRRVINSTVQVNLQTPQQVVAVESLSSPFSNVMLTEDRVTGSLMNVPVQDFDATVINPTLTEATEPAMTIPIAEESITPEMAEAELNKIKIVQSEQLQQNYTTSNTTNTPLPLDLVSDTNNLQVGDKLLSFNSKEAGLNEMSQEPPIEFARRAETESLTQQRPVQESDPSPKDNVMAQEFVEQAVTQATENKQNPQKLAVDHIATTRHAQVTVDTSPPLPDKRKTSEVIPRTDSSDDTQQAGINVLPKMNGTNGNSVDSAHLQNRPLTVPISERQAVQTNVTDKVYTSSGNQSQINQVSLTDKETTTIKAETLPPDLTTERIPTADGQLQDSGIIQQSQQNETTTIRTSGNSQTAQPAQAQATLTLSSFVPDVSEWMGRFFKITRDKTGTDEAKFSMYPEHLGHLEIKIAAQKGHITAQIIADTQTAKEALEGQLSMLKQALQQQGLQVQKIEIIQHMPNLPDVNQGNNPSFSQGGSNQNQQHFNQQNEQSGNNASQSTTYSAEKEDGALPPVDKEKSVPAFTYGGNQVRTSSRIDFSA
ncbi:flagellar hook-length control protein FliK [Bacillus sp. DNRA2]|uniref:flagellar hook-length control protein FliK n=1 Tax=Bacillus sp. DNRA2 TaxID=2723053 RepID=UPI00145D4389|nr:flagellar hook-length control protein FliK [Bacillus sp. DNRA2]NMD69110.1 flagellar hook-length control protein FliK [Bacillus sp. DNRA2]